MEWLQGAITSRVVEESADNKSGKVSACPTCQLEGEHPHVEHLWTNYDILNKKEYRRYRCSNGHLWSDSVYLKSW